MRSKVICLGTLLGGTAAIALALTGCQRHDDRSKVNVGQPAPEQPPAHAATYTAADLLTAFKEAYGQPAPVEVTDENGEKMISNPAALIDITPEIVALIVKDEIPDGCHACTGADSIFYMRHSGKSFELLGKWPHLTGHAGFGRAADWTQRNDLTKYPALSFAISGGGMGCEITSGDIVELTPSRPIVRAEDVLTRLQYTPGESEKSPPREINGTISATGPEKTLKVTYAGTENFTLEFILDDDKWVPDPTKHAAPEC